MGKTEYVKKSIDKDPSYKLQLKNLPAKKYRKGTPSQIRLSFELSGGTTQFIDIAQALSIINRRHYTSGAYYYVNSVELYNDEDAFVDLHVIPDTWVSRGAWRRGAAVWHEMNMRALERTGGILPKYYDFRPYMSERHRSVGNRNPALHDINSAQRSYGADEWDYSQLVSADSDGDIANPGTPAAEVNQQADNFYVHMLGDHVGSSDNWTSVGLIKSYAESRPRIQTYSPNTPATASEDPLVNLFDYSTEEQLNDVIDLLEDSGDSAPYDHDFYLGQASETPGGADTRTMQHVARLVTTVTMGRKDSSAGFCAMGGLICVDPQATATAYRIVVNLAPGTYNGVYAERI